MKKPSLIKRFFSFLLKVIVVFALMAIIAVGSFEGVTYYLTGSLYDLRKLAVTSPAETTGDSADKVEEVENKDVKSTLLFVESADGENCYMAMNMMNTKSGAVDILLIPLHAQVTIGGDFLKEVQKKMPSAGNTLNLDDVSRALGEEKYSMITDIFSNVMGVKLEQYDVLNQKQFVKMLDLADSVNYSMENSISYRDKDKVLHSIEEGEQAFDGTKAVTLMEYLDGSDKQESARLERVNTYLESWLDSLLRDHKGQEMIRLLEKTANSSEGRDFTEEQKIWKDLSGEAVTVRILQGAENDGSFAIDSQKAKLQIATLIKQGAEFNAADADTDAVMPEEDDTGTAASSKEYSIELYNAAYVSGLAGEWENFLEEQGYSISLIDSYQDEGPISQTRIIVSQEGIGQDLLKYFPDADIWTDEINTGGDIQIYIGTDSTSVGGDMTSGDTESSGDDGMGTDDTDEDDSEDDGSPEEDNGSDDKDTGSGVPSGEDSYSFDTDSE